MGPSEKDPKIRSSCKAERKRLRVGSYFLNLSLSTQIVYILEKPEIHFNNRILVPGIVLDIQGGAECQKPMLKVGPDDIIIMWNCDGLSVFNGRYSDM